jgi:NADH-quinone oxidoreductase subunit J
MEIGFYIASALAIFTTVMVITRLNAVHALLYLVNSLFASSVVFFTLGAPFMAALEIIIYAGAIMVLFIFVVMMLNLGKEAIDLERSWSNPRTWIGPGIISVVLLAELVYLIFSDPSGTWEAQEVGPKLVGLSLYGPYMLAVELSAMLLMAGIVGAYHLGRQEKIIRHRFLQKKVEP